MSEQQAQTGNHPPHNVLVVDDDDVFRERLVRALHERGFRACGARNADQAIEFALREAPSYALVDLRMPDCSGLDVLAELRALFQDLRIVILTGFGSIVSAVEAVRAGANNYLTKPADVDEIIAAFEHNHASVGACDGHQVPSLDRVQWEHIQRVLHGCAGNVSHAARLLGLHRRSLQRKLTKLRAAR
jgi:two-component system response regulator RegA